MTESSRTILAGGGRPEGVRYLHRAGGQEPAPDKPAKQDSAACLGAGTEPRATRPVLARGFRLQWEPAQSAHVLLYPEGMVKLNSSAAAILTRCDGLRTVVDIVADIEKTYGVTGLSADITAFVAMAREKSWLEVRA